MPTHTFKIVYIPREIPGRPLVGGARGVALIEAANSNFAHAQFRREYAGQYYTIESCKQID